jgi:hypothetical protein
VRASTGRMMAGTRLLRPPRPAAARADCRAAKN